MEINTVIEPAGLSPRRRARVILEVRTTKDEREEMARACGRAASVINHLLLPARFVGREILVRDVLDKKMTITVTSTAFAEAIVNAVRTNGCHIRPTPPPSAALVEVKRAA